MRTFITSMAVAMLFAVTANADVIHSTDFEADGAAQGAVLGIVPQSIDGFIIGGGGDHVGLTAQGLSSANSSSGSFSYAVDVGDTVDNGNGWGATWAGINSNSGNTSGGFGDEAAVIAANSGSYINYDVGTTFTASALIAQDPNDPLTGSAFGTVRLEFLADGSEFSQADRQISPTVGVTNISDAYQQVSITYALTQTDIDNGINGVNAVLGTDGSGFGATDGTILFDDLLFEVDGASVVTLAVPEPGSAALLLAGLMGLCGVRRRNT